MMVYLWVLYSVPLILVSVLCQYNIILITIALEYYTLFLLFYFKKNQHHTMSRPTFFFSLIIKHLPMSLVFENLILNHDMVQILLIICILHFWDLSGIEEYFTLQKNHIKQKYFQSITPQFFKKISFIYFQTEWEEGRKRGKHQCVVASCAPPTGDMACNPGMCPDWELNW